MSLEKEPGYIAYKFHDLKVYGSTEWLADGKKKYRQVFEASESGYIYSELSFYNKLFDEKDWTVKVNLKCFELNADRVRVKELCSIDVNREVKSNENMVYIREGWGNSTAGQFWKKGRFVWVASLDEVVVGERYFYVESHGPVTGEGNPYFGVGSLKLFEGPNALPLAGDRKYYLKYDQADTRWMRWL